MHVSPAQCVQLQGTQPFSRSCSAFWERRVAVAGSPTRPGDAGAVRACLMGPSGARPTARAAWPRGSVLAARHPGRHQKRRSSSKIFRNVRPLEARFGPWDREKSIRNGKLVGPLGLLGALLGSRGMLIGGLVEAGSRPLRGGRRPRPLPHYPPPPPPPVAAFGSRTSQGPEMRVARALALSDALLKVSRSSRGPSPGPVWGAPQDFP